MTYRIISTFVFILLFAATGFSQDKLTWITELEKVIAQKEPAWKIERKNLQDANGGSYNYSLTLISGANRSSIQISRLYKVPNAAETFAGQVLIFDNISGKRNFKSKLKNYGDEGFMWTTTRKGSWTNIHFRKSDIFVRVFAPAPNTAKRFADYVLRLLPAD